jgi:enamine deaminase RidA (YjgF/YER057c/UK114 family)
LARTGQIRLRRGRWELREVLAVDTRRDAESELAVRAWWLEAALARLRAGDTGIFSYNVFAVSEADFQRINDLYRAYFRQVRSIIGQSEPSERVVLFCLQLLPLDRHVPQAP